MAAAGISMFSSSGKSQAEQDDLFIKELEIRFSCPYSLEALTDCVTLNCKDPLTQKPYEHLVNENSAKKLYGNLNADGRVTKIGACPICRSEVTSYKVNSTIRNLASFVASFIASRKKVYLPSAPVLIEFEAPSPPPLVILQTASWKSVFQTNKPVDLYRKNDVKHLSFYATPFGYHQIQFRAQRDGSIRLNIWFLKTDKIKKFITMLRENDFEKTTIDSFEVSVSKKEIEIYSANTHKDVQKMFHFLRFEENFWFPDPHASQLPRLIESNDWRPFQDQM